VITEEVVMALIKTRQFDSFLIQIIHVFLIINANFISQTTALLSHHSALLFSGTAHLQPRAPLFRLLRDD